MLVDCSGRDPVGSVPGRCSCSVVEPAGAGVVTVNVTVPATARVVPWRKMSPSSITVNDSAPHSTRKLTLLVPRRPVPVISTPLPPPVGPAPPAVPTLVDFRERCSERYG